MSVASPRKSVKDTVFESVLGRHHRCASSSSLASSSSSHGGCSDDENDMEMVQLGAERAKNVLILMSDTGGGHRASAEAIKDAFRLEFGDEYRVMLVSFKTILLLWVVLSVVPGWGVC